MRTIERHVDSKPRKDSLADVIAHCPDIAKQIEALRSVRQRNWELDLVGELIGRGIPADIATVAARHSRTFQTGHERATTIAELLAELQRV